MREFHVNSQAGRLLLLSIILIAVIASCSDDPGQSTESPPSPSASTLVTNTPIPPATNTLPPTPKADPTWTPAPTFTPEPTYTPAPTATPTLTPTPTVTPTPEPTATPTETPTPTPTPDPFNLLNIRITGQRGSEVALAWKQFTGPGSFGHYLVWVGIGEDKVFQKVRPKDRTSTVISHPGLSSQPGTEFKVGVVPRHYVSGDALMEGSSLIAVTGSDSN